MSTKRSEKMFFKSFRYYECLEDLGEGLLLIFGPLEFKIFNLVVFAFVYRFIFKQLSLL